MKVLTSESNIEVEVIVKSNDKQVPEYMLASRPTNNNQTNSRKECYVALDVGNSASVYTWFSGRVCNARYDLYIDGAYYGCRDILSGQRGVVKEHHRRRAEFRGIQASQLQTEEDADPRGLVVDAELCVKPIDFTVDPQRLGGSGKAYGVGSIVVVVTRELEPFKREQHKPDPERFSDYIHGNWSRRDAVVEDPTIPPDEYIDLKHVYRGIIPQKCNKFRHDFDNWRNGLEPLATFVFYYRSKKALNRAGCIPAPDRTWTIAEVGPDEDHVVQSPNHTSDDDIDPMEDINAIFMEQEGMQSKRRLGGPLDVKDLTAAVSFRRFVEDTERARHDRWMQLGYTSVITLAGARSDKVQAKLYDDGQCEVVLDNHRFVLPPKQSLKDLIREGGTLLQGMLSVLVPGLDVSLLPQAMGVLTEHLKGLAQVFEDDLGRPYAMLDNEAAQRLAYLRAEKRAAPNDGPDESSKRVKVGADQQRVALPPSGGLAKGLSTAQLRQQALERKRQLEEEARQLDALLRGYDAEDSETQDGLARSVGDIGGDNGGQYGGYQSVVTTTEDGYEYPYDGDFE